MGNLPNKTPSDSILGSNLIHDQLGVVMLGAADLYALLPPKLCLEALEKAYVNLYESPSDGGQSVEFRADKGKFHIKAGLSPRTHKYFAAKVNANFPGNPATFGLPTIQGLIVLFACDVGRPLAVLHSGELTALRTAAATALAAKHGARSYSSKLAVIGCGMQARYQLEAILDVLPIRELVACDQDRKKALAFVKWAEQKFAIAAKTTTSIAGALRTSDVCVTCTTSTRAIVEANMVPSGCFIAAVGADNPDKQEIDPKVFAEARIIVDDLKQASVYGDLAQALRDGIVAVDDVGATLADLAAGTKPGRTCHDEIVIFDSTGVGVQDVAVAAAAYEAMCVAGEPNKRTLSGRLAERFVRTLKVIERHLANGVPRDFSWTMKL